MIAGICVASKGRPATLATTLPVFVSLGARYVVVVVTDPADLPGAIPDGIEVLYGPAGSCTQRNIGIDHLIARVDLIVFFDDDFVPAVDWIDRAIDAVSTAPHVRGVTGRVLLDGVTAPTPITFEGALEAIERHRRSSTPRGDVKPVRSLYGCNMAFPTCHIGDARFDERLVLYGWQEDVDFSSRIRGDGSVVVAMDVVGVHLGSKGARSPGRRVGYSQVVNVAYLLAKGTMDPSHGLGLMVRNIARNLAGLVIPDRYVDRAGRFIGNLIGLWDVVRGRLTPERARDL